MVFKIYVYYTIFNCLLLKHTQLGLGWKKTDGVQEGSYL